MGKVKICRKIEEEIPKEPYDFYVLGINQLNDKILRSLEKEKTMFELIGRSVFVDIKEKKFFRTDDLITLSTEKEEKDKNIFRINKDVLEDFEEGQYILLGRGNIMGIIEEIGENSVVFRVIREGYLERNPDVKIFGREFSLELLDEKDVEFLENQNPYYCIIGGIKEKSEIKRIRKEYDDVIFIPRVDTREFVQNFEDFIKNEIFLYFSKDSLSKNFPLSFVQKMEMGLIKRANEEGIGSIVEINVEDPTYRYDLYNYLMNRVDMISLVGKEVPEEIYKDIEKVSEYFDLKIPGRYLSVIRFLEENSEMDRIFLDVEDIRMLAYFSKRRTWRKIFCIKNDALDHRIAKLFSNVEISEGLEEGYPVLYEREDVLSIRIPKQ